MTSNVNAAQASASRGIALMQRLRAWRPTMNPVLGRELRSRMRDWRFSLVLSGYLVGLGLVAFSTLYLMTSQLRYGGVIGPDAGVRIYAVLAFMQLILIGVLAPALTVGTISGERERRTMDLLLVTRMSATSIVVGKLLASLAYTVLLIVASMPVFSLVFLFGGVSLKQLGLTFLLYLATTLTLGAVGLLASTLFRRTAVASVAAYGVVAFLFVGTLAYLAFRLALPGSPYGPMPPARGMQPAAASVPWVVFANPLVALASSLPGYGMGGGILSGMLNEIIFRAFSVPGPNGPIRPTNMPTPWVVYLWISLGIFALSLFISVLHLTPVKPWTRWLAAWRRRRQARRDRAMARSESA
ncbi:MAG: ABC transporter permease [Bacillota bacterium]